MERVRAGKPSQAAGTGGALGALRALHAPQLASAKHEEAPRSGRSSGCWPGHRHREVRQVHREPILDVTCQHRTRIHVQVSLRNHPHALTLRLHCTLQILLLWCPRRGVNSHLVAACMTVAAAWPGVVDACRTMRL
jgi:hypothetical protein